MYCINEHSTKVFNHLLSLLSKGYLKLDNAAGTFMPVSVERVYTHSGFEEVYSVSHYGEQNGDLMAAPDMTFGQKEGKFYPLSFRNDYAGVYQEVIDEQVNLKLQKGLADFTNTWLQNIKEQQKLNI